MKDQYLEDQEQEETQGEDYTPEPQHIRLTVGQLLLLIGGTALFTVITIFGGLVLIRGDRATVAWPKGTPSVISTSTVSTPERPPSTATTSIACPMDAKLCPDGVTSVGRTGPTCTFAACPEAHPVTGKAMEDGVICPTDTKKCSDGTVLHRTGVNCTFPRCTTDAGVYGRCSTSADCPSSTTCVDASAVSRPGMEAKRCWPKNEPLPQ